ncbi:MAG: DsrE family protein [Betaproteobacteria bacterium]|nr:DsrE family protein [Betaproteobacteria bacterium]
MADTARYYAGLQRAWAVYDFTTGDDNMFFDRINLAGITADSFRKRGIEPHFVALIHGPSTKYVTRTFKGTKFEGDVCSKLGEIQALLERLSLSGGFDLVVCGIAMTRHLVSKDNLVPFATVENNVAETSIALQNQGYAYMQVDLLASPPRL